MHNSRFIVLAQSSKRSAAAGDLVLILLVTRFFPAKRGASSGSVGAGLKLEVLKRAHDNHLC